MEVLKDSPREAAKALETWIVYFGITTAVAAAILGTSRRTVARWRKCRHAPRWVAHVLEQFTHGPALRGRVARGAFEAFRDNYVRRRVFGPDGNERLLKCRGRRLPAVAVAVPEARPPGAPTRQSIPSDGCPRSNRGHSRHQPADSTPMPRLRRVVAAAPIPHQLIERGQRVVGFVAQPAHRRVQPHDRQA